MTQQNCIEGPLIVFENKQTNFSCTTIILSRWNSKLESKISLTLRANNHGRLSRYLHIFRLTCRFRWLRTCGSDGRTGANQYFNTFQDWIKIYQSRELLATFDGYGREIKPPQQTFPHKGHFLFRSKSSDVLKTTYLSLSNQIKSLFLHPS